ncbi:hypothetical protein BAUCODRAFT_149573 [Baudoinia panamericana UAMH 10762]|uniref:Uncharacterized protein n=1 Tax=Baudoinia panamericana (strain UAMH 10762) TaxID=717646 RepID=M2N5U8_BAUPA|nr:uncharacterized protein BAUCODRAFT_149573 [Baudoinia panamericana UAMH 10762]EMC94414.1 hypothetical protein BAUCODRAFT_149573 [Baudoinia panamericana UAMH 10762]
MPTLRHKKSKAAVHTTALNTDDDETPSPSSDNANPLDTSNEPRPNKKRALQDFFRHTYQTARLPHRERKARPHGRKARVAKPELSPKRNSRHVQSFDISDDVLDRLMRSTGDDGTKIQSPNFLIKQKLKVTSRAPALDPDLSSPSDGSEVETDHKPLSSQEVDLQPLSQDAVDPKSMSCNAVDHTPFSRENVDLNSSTQEEVESMFVGAPHIAVEEVERGRVWRPQVIFRGGNAEESKKYAHDYVDLGHPSFAACTLGLHRTRETGAEALISRHDTANQRPGGSMLEVPNMLSANGLDLGTTGFEHFLQLPIADSAKYPDEPVLFEKRKLLSTEPEELGLREQDIETVVDRLTELGHIYSVHRSQSAAERVRTWTEEKVADMGEELFAKRLDPELGTTGAGTGSVTLKTQISALQRVLGETELWHDFSQVEWRIRVGQLLWKSGEDEAALLDGQPQQQLSERDILLLQITLAAELMIRLEALNSAGWMVFEDERAGIYAAHSRKLQWDVLLAQTFLENMTIGGTGSANAAHTPVILPKRADEQLDGLLHFARVLQWPHSEDVRLELAAKLGESSSQTPQTVARRTNATVRPVSGFSIYATPLSSPMHPAFTPSANRTSYFGGLLDHTRRPGPSRMTTASSMQLLTATAAVTFDEDRTGFEVGGWLSRSWLSGLVLPGEPAGHFLISTLLENSPEAIEALGDSANLYGGFVYQGRSYWSKGCVAGRVLAASKGAVECMGWVSVPLTFRNAEVLADGWVNLDVKDVPTADAETVRIKDTEAISRASDPFHGTPVSSLQAHDFTIPTDSPSVIGSEVTYEGITFIHSQTSFELVRSEADALEAASTSVAHLTFILVANKAATTPLEIPLTYDIQFVASYPCHPPKTAAWKVPRTPNASDSVRTTPNASDSVHTSLRRHSRATSSISSAGAQTLMEFGGTTTARPVDSPRSPMSSRTEKELPAPPAHPLHVDYHFSIVPATSLLVSQPGTLPRVLAGNRELASANADANEVVVLDCRGLHDLELLGRSWCSKVGENALIGKSGRTCLACCIREAKALDIKVVIRT